MVTAGAGVIWAGYKAQQYASKGLDEDFIYDQYARHLDM